jgi:hypothetical protein
MRTWPRDSHVATAEEKEPTIEATAAAGDQDRYGFTNGRRHASTGASKNRQTENISDTCVSMHIRNCRPR